MRLHLRHMTNDVRVNVTDLLYKVDITTYERTQGARRFRSQRHRLCPPQVAPQPSTLIPGCATNHITGSFVLVDEQTNNTVAAGMILRAVGDETIASPDEFAI